MLIGEAEIAYQIEGAWIDYETMSIGIDFLMLKRLIASCTSIRKASEPNGLFSCACPPSHECRYRHTCVTAAFHVSTFLLGSPLSTQAMLDIFCEFSRIRTDESSYAHCIIQRILPLEYSY